jgi:enamine deaminase RidA (YjgF/YER057c/UK114 family)
MERQRVSSGTEWEDTVGYSRAVRAGDRVCVSGTTATDEHGDPLDGTPYEQASTALETIESALEGAEASVDDVVRTRIYVTDADDWPEIGRAHSEFFADVRPAATMIEVQALIDPRLCVEIEAEAVVDS